MAIIYEVNLNVDASIAKPFKIWLGDHLDKMLQYPGFLRAELYSELESGIGEVGFSVRYLLTSRSAFDNYVENHAANMRQDANRKFGTKFTASRRLLRAENIKEKCHEPECA